MNSNEFIFWLRGIVDSTEELPSKETWEKISDILKTVKLNGIKWQKQITHPLKKGK